MNLVFECPCMVGERLVCMCRVYGAARMMGISTWENGRSCAEERKAKLESAKTENMYAKSMMRSIES